MIHVLRHKNRDTVTSERDLLSGARQFEPSALAEIYDLYSPRLFRYAFRLLGDECAAEDCTAETFSRFLQSLRHGRGPRDYLQAFLFRTAHNYIVDYFRKTPIQPLDEHFPDVCNPEATANSKLRREHTRTAIQELSPDQQQVIALKFWEGYENEEIARALHKPIGAIKSLQHRALAHLQKILLDDEV